MEKIKELGNFLYIRNVEKEYHNCYGNNILGVKQMKEEGGIYVW